MEAVTHTELVHPATAGRMKAKADKLARRIARTGMDATIDCTVGAVTLDDHDFPQCEVTVTYSGIFAVEGDWAIVAIADAAGTDEPMIYTFDSEGEFDTTQHVDMTRCDHCHRSVRRNKAVFVRNSDGDMKQVGGTCAQDHLGLDPSNVTFIIESGDDQDGGSKAPTTFPMVAAVQAAITANNIGFQSVRSESTCTRDITAMILTGAIERSTNAHIKEALAEARRPLDERLDAEQVIEWMLTNAGDSEFGHNMARIARSEYVGMNTLGLIAYAPAGFMGWQQKAAERKAKAEAEAARKEAATPVPVTNERIKIEGEVTTIREQHSDYGTAYKMRVVTPDGWAAWGSVPSAILADVEVGNKVRFTARVVQSEDDALFGFWNRPTKAEII